MYYVNEGSTYAIGILFPVICTASVYLRLLARKRLKIPYAADDYMACVALLFTIANGVVLIVGDAYHVIGWHSPKQTAAASLMSENRRIQLAAIFQYVFLPLSVLTIAFIRLTFVFLYRRIFLWRIFHGKTINAVHWGIIGLISLWTVAYFFGYLFQCAPHFSAFWVSQDEFEMHCSFSFKILSSMSLVDVVIDLCILALPIVPVWQLNMSTYRKILVCMVFGLGIFSIAAGITRMIIAFEILTYDYGSSNKLFGLAGTSDSIGVISVLLWWGYVEIGVGCLVSNLPPMIGLARSERGFPFSTFLSRFSLHSWASRSWTSRSRQYSSQEEEGKELEAGHGPRKISLRSIDSSSSVHKLARQHNLDIR